MTDLERMAREAGAQTFSVSGVITPKGPAPWGYFMPPEVAARFAALIRADERERCAKVCEGLRDAAEHSSDGLKRAGALSMATSCAKLIRSQ